MHQNSHLREMILKHWLTHHPQMVEQLRRLNQLESAIAQAEERTADLLYELLSVKKMQYQDAWELATQEWRDPPST